MNSIVKIESLYKKREIARGAKDTDIHKNIVTAYIIVSNALSLTQHSTTNWPKFQQNMFTLKETIPRATEDA